MKSSLVFDRDKGHVKHTGAIKQHVLIYKQANSKNCGPPASNMTLKKVKGQGQGQCMVPIGGTCHKDHSCQISMLYR